MVCRKGGCLGLEPVLHQRQGQPLFSFDLVPLEEFMEIFSNQRKTKEGFDLFPFSVKPNCWWHWTKNDRPDGADPNIIKAGRCNCKGWKGGVFKLATLLVHSITSKDTENAIKSLTRVKFCEHRQMSIASLKDDKAFITMVLQSMAIFIRQSLLVWKHSLNTTYNRTQRPKNFPKVV